MEYNNIIPKIQYNNFLNGNNIYLYKDSYILSEFQKELNHLDKEIQKDEIYINNKLKNLANIDNQKIHMNLKTYNDNNQNPYFFQTFNNNISKKYNNIPQRNKIFTNNSMTNIKNLNKRDQIGIIKSEPNLYKSQSNNNINKKIIPKTNNISFYDDLSDISEIKKTDLSLEEQNINPDFNIDYLTQENNKKCVTLNNFYNNLKVSKVKKGIPYMKEMEIKKIVNDYPEVIYNEIYKSVTKVENLKKENNMLKNKIKKLKMEIKEKNKKNKLEDIRNKYKDKQIVKLDSSLATENNILNELKESNDSTIMKNMINENKKKKKKSKNKNKSGYMDELSQDKSSNETREQRLEKIRKKYLYDNPNDEINELNTNEEQTKETNLIKENLINENDINKEEKINDIQNENEDKEKDN